MMSSYLWPSHNPRLLSLRMPTGSGSASKSALTKQASFLLRAHPQGWASQDDPCDTSDGVTKSDGGSVATLAAQYGRHHSPTATSDTAHIGVRYGNTERSEEHTS